MEASNAKKAATVIPHFENYEYHPGNATRFIWKDNYLEIHTDNYVILRIYVLEENILRFRYTTNGLWEDDFSYAVDPKYTPSNPGPEITDDPETIFLETKELKVCVRKVFVFITIMDKNDRIINEDEKGFHWEDFRKYGGHIVKQSKKVQIGEAFYGLGDKPVNLNLRGKRFKNWGTDEYGYNADTDPLYKNINVYYGLHGNIGYGIFLDNTFKSFFDFASERKTVTSFWSDGGHMNYYFFYGPSLRRAAESYTLITGRPEMPPLWALGYQQCKWSYQPDSQVREIADKMRALQIPCDAIYLDIDYMDGFRCFTWDKEKFPDPKGLVAYLDSIGFRTMVIIDPGIKIDRAYDVFNEAFERGYFCRRADGPYVKGKVWPGECHFPDYTHPEVRKWWSGLFRGLIEDTGVAGVWNDMNEPALFEVETKTFPLDVRHDYDGHPCSHRKAHNVYGMQMARATFDGVKKYLKGRRPLVITRSGYNGLQRFTCVWTGDNLATWEHLMIAHQQTMRLSISGISFCGSDIGGFIGQPNGELFVRWMQQAIFHPFFRTHSSGDHGEQEPWSFGDEYTDYVRIFINMRYKLLPYIYTTFYQYHKFGTPMLLPLSFGTDQDAQAFANEQMECYLGEHVLFSPVIHPGARGTTVYLPSGSWFDYFNKQEFGGDQEMFVEADLGKIPTFIRGGAIIPHFPLMQYTREHPVDTIELQTYYKEGITVSHIYFDEYDGYAYEKGGYRYSTLKQESTPTEVTIIQDFTGAFDPGHLNYQFVFFGLPFEASKYIVDGVEIKTNTGKSNNLLSLVINHDFKTIIVRK